MEQRQLEQQWAAMGFDRAVPAIEMVEDRSGRTRMVEDERGGGGSVANVQVLPVSNVASFQLWAVGARGRQKRQECRFPELRRVGVRAARLCPLSSVFCPPASVLCPLSSVLKGDEDKGQRTKDKGFRTLDIGTENRKS